MTDKFKADRIANEKPDPVEGNSIKFIYVPVILLSMFIGFGVTFLTLKTDNTKVDAGDSRTAVTTAVPPPAGGNPAALVENGKRVFTTTCQACHQANGAGIPGAFPPLDGSEWVSGSPAMVAAIVLHGLQGEITVKGQKFQAAMPPLKDQLKDEDIAAVVTYVRQAWSNKSDGITLEAVQSVREKTKDHTGPWAGEAELRQQKWD